MFLNIAILNYIFIIIFCISLLTLLKFYLTEVQVGGIGPQSRKQKETEKIVMSAYLKQREAEKIVMLASSMRQ